MRSGLKIIDERPRIKDRNRWRVTSSVAGGIGKESTVEEETQPFGKQKW